MLRDHRPHKPSNQPFTQRDSIFGTVLLTQEIDKLGLKVAHSFLSRSLLSL